MMRPLVKPTSRRIWVASSQPAWTTAGVMYLAQMSASLRSLLYMGTLYQAGYVSKMELYCVTVQAGMHPLGARRGLCIADTRRGSARRSRSSHPSDWQYARRCAEYASPDAGHP